MRLIGLDFGSTTSGMVLASTDVLSNRVTGKMEFANLKVLFQSEPVFTPFLGDEIDEKRLKALLDEWFRQAGLLPLLSHGALEPELACGGAIVTGLAAQTKNADRIINQVRSLIGEAVIVVADDPSLESWVSFMGNCFNLSINSPQVPFLNLDIGGGTTNLSLGIQGEVIDTSCHWIGARHFQFSPGSYQILDISRFGQEVLKLIGISKSIGDSFARSEVESIITHYVHSLEELVIAQSKDQKPIITFSGGVGELIYKQAQGHSLPGKTFYGDFGVDLAKQIFLHSPLLSANLKTHLPTQKGRATVYGLMLHSTRLSGQTLFLPHPEILPLRDIPILGSLSDGFKTELDSLLLSASKTTKGGCIKLRSTFQGLDSIRRFSKAFREALIRHSFPKHLPLILLSPQNIGKTLGNYITEWGEYPINLIIIDEIEDRQAHFLCLGEPRNGVVTVSLYGS